MARARFPAPPDPAPHPADAQAGPIAPYGGRLVQRNLQNGAAPEVAARAKSLRRLRLPDYLVADLDLLGNGAYSPLEGFMGEADHRAVVEEMHLSNGLPWTIPVTLPIPDGSRAPRPGAYIALADASDRLLAVMRVDEVFRRDPEREAQCVYGTAEARHPGVGRLMAQGSRCLAGPVWIVRRPEPAFPDHQLDPLQTRAFFRARGWRRVVAFQTRNPVHRAHEYIQKCALEVCDGLLLHPLVGETKEDDVPAAVRFAAYETALSLYYPADRVMLAAFPAAMRYAGPREAVHHAIARRNYGCTHIVIGRDHAGVGGYYGTYDAQRIFDRIDRQLLGIEPLCFDHAFFCRACDGMATARTCPHGPEWHVTLSGTRVREMLRRGELPPPEFTRPEVASLLVRAYEAAGRGEFAGCGESAGRADSAGPGESAGAHAPSDAETGDAAQGGRAPDVARAGRRGGARDASRGAEPAGQRGVGSRLTSVAEEEMAPRRGGEPLADDAFGEGEPAAREKAAPAKAAPASRWA